MRVVLLVLLVSLSISSCKKRLDDFLFVPDNSITEYKMDAYDGYQDTEVGEEYFIHPDNIYPFSVPMVFEGVEMDVQMIYVGDISSINTDTVLLYCHGNTGHMDSYWPRQKLYANAGGKNRIGVLALDYPGYGLSDGSPTEENMYASVNTALKWLKEQGLTDDRLIMYGFSLGSAPVCEVAGNPENYEMTPSKIMLEAPFASAEVMVQDAALLAMPSSYFVNVKIDNAEEIKKANMPLFWIHGKKDDYLAIDTHGELVFANHTGEKVAVRVDGAGHSNIPGVYGLENCLKDMEDFIFN